MNVPLAENTPSTSPTPFDHLRFLYVGTSDFTKDDTFYRETLGAERVWAFHAFGARVAAYRLAPRDPLYLLADHRPAGSSIPVYEVAVLDEKIVALKARG